MFIFQFSDSDQKPVWFWKLPCRKDGRNTFFVTVSDVSHFEYAQGYVLAKKFSFSVFLEPCLSSTASHYWCWLTSLHWKPDFGDREKGAGGVASLERKRRKIQLSVYISISLLFLLRPTAFAEKCAVIPPMLRGLLQADSATFTGQGSYLLLLLNLVGLWKK